jgi:tetratricopeptide (TPR) repeat protein/O-antigen ligase
MQEPFLAKLLRWIIYATALMPLIIFSQYISPFHFGKVVIFRSIVEIMLVLYILLWLQDRSYRPRTNAIFWSFLGFTMVFTLTTITSTHSYTSFWGSLERMGGLWTFWHYFIFYVIITSLLRKKSHWETFLNVGLVSAILSAVYGFGQKTQLDFFIGSGGRERIFGTIGNAALFAGYEIVNVFLALTLWLRKGNSSIQKWLYGAATVLGTLAIIMTVVRGSLIGLGIGFFTFAVWYFLRTNSQNARKVILGISTVAIILFIIIVTPIKDSSLFKSSRFLSRITDTSFSSVTAKTRFWAWEAGFKGWSESPQKILVGWGPENFNIPFSKHFNPKFFTGYGSETLFDRAHNMFVEVLVTMGLLGLLSYVSIFVAAWLVLKRIESLQPENRLYRIGLTCLLIAYAIHNSFIFDTSANFLVFFTVLGFITYLYQRGQNVDITIPPQRSRFPAPLRVITATGLAVAAAILINKTNILPARANHTSTRAIIAGWANDFIGSVAKYKEALQYDVQGKYEIRHRFAQYVLEYSSAASKTTPGFEDAVKLAIDVVMKNRDENPNDYLPELYLSRLNIILGRDDPNSPYNDIALEHSLNALKISPTFIRTYYEIGQAYLNKKDYENAIKWFKTAAELNPDVGLSFWYWGIIEMTRGNTDEGLRIINIALESGYGPSESDYMRLADVYSNRKDYAALENVYKELIKLNPKQPQYFAGLAVIYANLGRIDEAVAMARQAVILDPSFLQEAQNFVRQLGRTL